MVTPLTQWKRYDVVRQKLMHEQLEYIHQHKKMSADLFEMVNKSI